MNIKKILLGEPMSDKNDPKYKERYEQEKRAGETFSQKVKLNYVMRSIQLWANNHRVGFLVIVFGIVITCFAINVFNLIRCLSASQERGRRTAVEQVDKALQQQRQQHKQ